MPETRRWRYAVPTCSFEGQPREERVGGLGLELIGVHDRLKHLAAASEIGSAVQGRAAVGTLAAGRHLQRLRQFERARRAERPGLLRAVAAQEARPFRPPGALELPQSLQMAASGQRADGSAALDRAAYFARGRQVFQAVVYADKLEPEATDPFFSGLAFE